MAAQIAERQHGSITRAVDHAGFNANVGTGQDGQIDSGTMDGLLRLTDQSANLVAAVRLVTAQLVRRGNDHASAIVMRHSRHTQTRTEVWRAIIDTREKMAVNVHKFALITHFGFAPFLVRSVHPGHGPGGGG
jgi:hypothetical protein